MNNSNDEYDDSVPDSIGKITKDIEKYSLSAKKKPTCKSTKRALNNKAWI